MGNYINSSCFQSIIQLFSKDSESITLNTRRRDGYKYVGGMKHGEVIFTIPHQCAHVKSPMFDDNFLTSLSYILQENDPLYKRVMQSIWLFNEACSDSYMISFEREVILFASAFEQLFDCGNCYHLTKIFGKLLKNYSSITVENSSRYEDIVFSQNHGDTEKKWILSRKWIEELYDLRSAYTHGEDTTRRNWGWNELEHTLMASFTFPMIVKILLAQESKYILTETDEVYLKVIDNLLDAQDWFKPKNPSDFISHWQKTISDYKFHLHLERAVEKTVRKHSLRKKEEPEE